MAVTRGDVDTSALELRISSFKMVVWTSLGIRLAASCTRLRRRGFGSLRRIKDQTVLECLKPRFSAS